jgi:hypothetical protein
VNETVDSGAARSALQQLHRRMAAFPVQAHRDRITASMADVPGTVIESVWDPRARTLLPPEVYLRVARACGGDDTEAAEVVVLYVRALLARDGKGADILTPGPPREPVRNGFDQPTVPRLRLPATLRPGAPAELSQVLTRPDFMRYLKTLVDRSGLTLREIQKATHRLDEGATTYRSTLSDAFRRGAVPTSEKAMRCLLTVLLARICEQGSEAPIVRRRVEETLEVWRRVLSHVPAEAPVLMSTGRASCPPLFAAALAELAAAEERAVTTGSADAPGLSAAQRILRGLLL